MLATVEMVEVVRGIKRYKDNLNHGLKELGAVKWKKAMK